MNDYSKFGRFLSALSSDVFAFFSFAILVVLALLGTIVTAVYVDTQIAVNGGLNTVWGLWTALAVDCAALCIRGWAIWRRTE